MLTRQRLVTYGIPTAATATIVLAALLTRSQSTGITKTEPPPSAKRQIDVVFAVDTTGSMGGLIDGAKRTVWSIANTIKNTDPNAELRIGLVAYRDVGDEYVTKDFALTTDLDAVFAELSAYRAAGGGDTPENVDAALDVTLHKMQWRSDAKKLVFLVGDAPPASRGDVPTFDVLAREAADKQITINTIRAGTDSETATTFQQIASLGKGEFSSIQQDGGVQQIATPYDDKLAELSSRIDSTAVIAGDEGVRRNYEAKMAAAAAAPAPAKADRAMYFKGGETRAAEDVVAGYGSGTMSVDSIESENLPATMRGMDKAQLKKELDRRVEDRRQAQQELAKVAKDRADYLEKNAKPDDAGFDGKVKATLEKQLK
ncbi:MAG: VWA domain-containing protein [Deltaproteobacteria bacterium]|nr:VWA domain-containing protein [Deltaproteobacteria bacterium]